MAQQAGTRNRPLSPHLQIWRWGPGMLSSILHRATGIAASVGILVLLWWLGALVSGPAAYAKFAAVAGHPLGILILVGISYSGIAHGVTGIRHFVLDTGAGYELEQNKLWANVCTAAGFVLTALFWAALLLR